MLNLVRNLLAAVALLLSLPIDVNGAELAAEPICCSVPADAGGCDDDPAATEPEAVQAGDGFPCLVSAAARLFVESAARHVYQLSAEPNSALSTPTPFPPRV